jgi:hypothetical protein
MPIVSLEEYRKHICPSDPTKVGDDLLNQVVPGAESTVEQFLGYQIAKREFEEYYPIAGRLDGGFDPLVDNYTYDSVNGRAVAQKDFRGAPGTRLQLRNTPVRADGLRVWEHYNAHAGSGTNPFNSDTELTIGRDFYVDWDSPGISRTGHLIRISGAWSTQPRSIKVIYSSGYVADELNNANDVVLRVAAIKLALLNTVLFTLKDVAMQQASAKGTFKPGAITSESLGNYSYSTGGVGSGQFGMAVALPASEMQRLQPYRSYGRLFA